ncbi:MAG: ATP-dependent DNA helicase [Pseudomarimonas sp.]
MSLASKSTAALADGGALAQAIDGFVTRPAQSRMAAAVANAMQSNQHLIAEAGTGTGKTYAYLVPALLSGQRVILSTGTRALQDQLYHRDLPRVREALGARLSTALLKGRSNYLCRYRLEQTIAEGRFTARYHLAELTQIRAWAGRSERGDISELDAIAEDSMLWPQVTSTAENCLGSDCPMYAECFVVRARQAAQEADVVIVNHHLLFADMALRQEGFGEILPGAHAFVLDEAHQLPELASQFFSVSVSGRQLSDLGRDALSECAGVAGALASVQAPAQMIEQRLREFRLAMDSLPGRAALSRLLANADAATALGPLVEALAELGRVLAANAERSPGFKACAERANESLRRMRQFADDAKPASADDDVTAAVRWYELSGRGFVLSETPLDVATQLRAYREQSGAAWIFTSATLAVGGRFDHFAEQMGLTERAAERRSEGAARAAGVVAQRPTEPATLLEPSPFDFPHQALAYLPKGLPEPASRDFGQALIEVLLPVLEASVGRAFLLFTSHRALRQAAADLAGRTPFPLFVQGTLPRSALLDAFRQSGNGVLLGAASFWEGVDVAGEALTVVAIDKLPFAAPDDPVLEARLDALRRRGGNPFFDWQLPSAVIALKQGAGRLIRTHADRGVLVLCDTRLVSKPYGRVFIDSLPPFKRTRELCEVVEFLHAPAGSTMSLEHAFQP